MQFTIIIYNVLLGPPDKLLSPFYSELKEKNCEIYEILPKLGLRLKLLIEFVSPGTRV